MDSVLMNVPASNIIPKYASLQEGAWYIIADNERTYNEMMQSIGVTELGILESTHQVINEEVSLSGIFESIKKWLSELWGKIKELFGKFLNMIKSIQDKISKKIDEILGKGRAKLVLKGDYLKDDYSIDSHSFEGFEAAIGMSDAAWKEIKDYDTSIKNITNKGYSDGKVLADNLKANEEKFFKALGSATGCNADCTNLTGEYTKKIIGKEMKWNKAYIKKNISLIVDMGLSFQYIQKMVKKPLNEVKKQFDNTIKYYNDLSKKNSEGSENLAKAIAYTKRGRNICTMAVSSVLSSAKMYVHSCQKVVISLAMASKKDEKKSTNESASGGVYGNVSFQSELNTLFNF